MVDARDPLTYRSEDLQAYCLDLHPTKRSLLLLNKADLLPEALRAAWADYFDDEGVDYVFWSARAGMEELSAGEHSGVAPWVVGFQFWMPACLPGLLLAGLPACLEWA